MVIKQFYMPGTKLVLFWVGGVNKIGMVSILLDLESLVVESDANKKCSKKYYFICGSNRK